ncbi:MAG: tyrosine recombinase XerC [Rickettsiales bacterium]|nr:tyrosine recombinase XerC [Rickettsiales bacterium]
MTNTSDTVLDSKIRKAYNEWLEWLAHEKAYAENTVAAYDRDLKQFFYFLTWHFGSQICWQHLKDELTVQDLRAWLVNQRNNAKNPNSSRRMLSSIRSFLQFLHKNYELDITSIRLLHTPRKQKQLPKALTPSETAFSIDTVDELSDEYWIGLRDKAILLLMYGCGLRISEALSLTKKQFKTPDAIIVEGKRNKERQIPLLPDIHKAVMDYINACPFDIKSDGTLFFSLRGKPLSRNNFHKQLQKLRKTYHLPEHTSAHAFRHSFASHLMQNNGDLRTIQELLGHANLSSTQIYTSIDAKRLLSVYQDAHPRDDA